MLGRRDLKFHIATIPHEQPDRQLANRRRRRRHVHRRDPPVRRRDRVGAQGALDAAGLRPRPSSRRSPASPPAPAPSTASSTGRRSRRTPCSSGAARVTALVTTAGFRDVLELRRLRIPHMYDPFWRKPDPLVPRRLRLRARRADGRRRRASLAPVDDRRGARARRAAARGRRRVGRRLPPALLPLPRARGAGRRDPARGAARASTVSLSSEILREQREYERSATTVVNAYVRPLMGRYVGDIRRGLDGAGVEAPLTIMQSSGGVMTSEDATLRPVLALESGPAAGVVAALGMARRLGFANAIAFDMGGTTAKASLIEGGAVSRGARVRGRRLALGRQPADARRRRAAADPDDRHRRGRRGRRLDRLARPGGRAPGRAAQRRRRAGAGLLRPRRRATRPSPTRTSSSATSRPARSPTGRSRSRAELAEQALARIAEPLGLSLAETAAGVHAIANARMTRALRSVSSEKGRDPREFALIAYGGAGPGARRRPRRGARLHDRARAGARRALQLARPALRAARVPRRPLLPPRRAHGRPGRARRRLRRAAGADRAVARRRGRVGARAPSSATAARPGRSRSSWPPAPSTRRARRR